MRTRDPRLENHGERTVTAARTVALTALALGAACASPGSIGRVDQLARATGARTVLLEEHFSLYSPYDLLRTREYVELVETQRAAVFELFGVQSEEPLVLWLRLDERMGVHASITDDRMRIESVSLETHDGILGEAGDGVVVVRVAPLDVIPLPDGRTITGTFGAGMYEDTLRHELAHVAAALLGLRERAWLAEGLAHVVEWIPIEDGHLRLDPPPEALKRAARLPPETRSLEDLLDWKQHFPPSDDDGAKRILACSLTAFLVAREGVPFREALLRVAALDERRILALQGDWSEWLDAIAKASSTVP